MHCNINGLTKLHPNPIIRTKHPTAAFSTLQPALTDSFNQKCSVSQQTSNPDQNPTNSRRNRRHPPRRTRRTLRLHHRCARCTSRLLTNGSRRRRLRITRLCRLRSRTTRPRDHRNRLRRLSADRARSRTSSSSSRARSLRQRYCRPRRAARVARPVI